MKNWFLMALCALMVCTGFTACSSDDSSDNTWKEGSLIELPRNRAFLLSEGNWGMNNSHLTFIDPVADTIRVADVFEEQNGVKLGDTGNDMLAYNGDVHPHLRQSKYLFKQIHITAGPRRGNHLLQSTHIFHSSLRGSLNIALILIGMLGRLFGLVIYRLSMVASKNVNLFGLRHYGRQEIFQFIAIHT